MPHVDCLYNIVQVKNTDPVQIQNSVKNFKMENKKIRDDMINFVDQLSFESIPKRKRTEDTINNKKIVALEICDIISNQDQKRFDFTKHLTAAQLFHSEKYVIYNKNFPSTTMNVDC